MSEAHFAVTQQEMINLAVEHWRLTGEIKEGASAGARHALRKIGDFLKARGIVAQSLDGLPYDEGMNATVVERIKGHVAGGGDMVVETVSPLVMREGEVVRTAEVVVAGG